MSQIFDALQRSEAESSGRDISELTEATELLERAERRTASRREAVAALDGGQSLLGELPPGFTSQLREKAAPSPSPEPAVQPRTMRVVEASAAEAMPAGQGQDDTGQFQSVQVHGAPLSFQVCHIERQSTAAEAFRLLGVRLRDLRRNRPLKRVLVTSTIPQEGKSVVAANLACTMALTTKQKTLLIEGDVRRPSLTKAFGLGNMPGLFNWLGRERNLKECIHHVEGPDFCILPAGRAPANPLELLQSGRLPLLLDQLDSWFDWIIIDSPPVLPLADTSVWMRLADGVLLVTRLGVTQKKELKRGLEALEPRKIVGAVVNSSAVGNYGYYYGTTESHADEKTYV
jgi:capsular exopolysaccharide synthesis family protein